MKTLDSGNALTTNFLRAADYFLLPTIINRYAPALYVALKNAPLLIFKVHVNFKLGRQA